MSIFITANIAELFFNTNPYLDNPKFVNQNFVSIENKIVVRSKVNSQRNHQTMQEKLIVNYR